MNGQFSNEKIKEFVLEQEKVADKCILGIGQYSLLEGYEHALEVELSKVVHNFK